MTHSKIFDKKTSNGWVFHVEHFDSPMEVAEVNKKREITSCRFTDKTKESMSKRWEGVDSYDEALDYMHNGYQPIVDEIKSNMRMAKMGVQEKRFGFRNNIVGFAPVVPLALQGIPNNMIDMRMKPMKAKVLDVYYDITMSSGTDPENILKAGQKMLAVLIKLEKKGYRFNLYAVQSYSDSKSADMIIVKIKSANQKLDLKRASFPLMHPAFFRVIGFDWYSRVPGGTYRCGYGSAISYKLSTDQMQKMFTEMFGGNAVIFTAQKLQTENEEHIEGVITNAK